MYYVIAMNRTSREVTVFGSNAGDPKKKAVSPFASRDDADSAATRIALTLEFLPVKVVSVRRLALCFAAEDPDYAGFSDVKEACSDNIA